MDPAVVISGLFFDFLRTETRENHMKSETMPAQDGMPWVLYADIEKRANRRKARTKGDISQARSLTAVAAEYDKSSKIEQNNLIM